MTDPDAGDERSVDDRRRELLKIVRNSAYAAPALIVMLTSEKAIAQTAFDCEAESPPGEAIFCP